VQRTVPPSTDIQHQIDALLAQGVPATDAEGALADKCIHRLPCCLTAPPALWTFVEQDGVEPTNNRAERDLRHAGHLPQAVAGLPLRARRARDRAAAPGGDQLPAARAGGYFFLTWWRSPTQRLPTLTTSGSEASPRRPAERLSPPPPSIWATKTELRLILQAVVKPPPFAPALTTWCSHLVPFRSRRETWMYSPPPDWVTRPRTVTRPLAAFAGERTIIPNRSPLSPASVVKRMLAGAIGA
jgi:hypothetical protein